MFEKAVVKTKLIRPTYLARGLSEDEILSYIPALNFKYEDKESILFKMPAFTRSSITVGTLEDYEHYAAIARSRLEPDLAIVVCIPDDNNKPYLVVLFQSGFQLFGVYDLADHLDVDDISVGAWAFHCPKIHSGYSHSYDYGDEYYFEVSGDFFPLTDADLALLEFDINELGEHIIEYLKDSGHEITEAPEEVARRYMDMARDSLPPPVNHCGVEMSSPSP